jgi:dienelactone hydrolase
MPPMIEQTLDIATKDGAMETFICHPERGGPFPAVFLLMDAPGIREELRDMARRLGTVGYYRSAAEPVLPRRPRHHLRPGRAGPKAAPSRHGCARCAPR